MSRLLAAALDDARMARENGQGRGAAFIAGLEAQLFAAAPGLTGSLAVSGTWVRAGLAPPDCLARGQEHDADVPPAGDPGDIEAMLEGLLGTVISESGGSVSAMHAMFAEMLPTVPVEARDAGADRRGPPALGFCRSGLCLAARSGRGFAPRRACGAFRPVGVGAAFGRDLGPSDPFAQLACRCRPARRARRSDPRGDTQGDRRCETDARPGAEAAPDRCKLR